VLYDVPGPRGRRRILVGSIVAALVIGALAAVALVRLAHHGQLDAARWKFVTEPSILRYLMFGLLNTLKVAAVAGGLALAVGALMAVGRLAPSVLVRAGATSYVQFCRSLPVLPLILFIGLGFPELGVRLPAFWFLVVGLALYNSAVFAEIFRAGVVSLPRGQREAAYALGLTYWGTMRLVLLPQAVRRVLPATLSQFVVLLKDSSLGFVISYPELLRRGQITGEFTHSILQVYVVVAVIYIIVNATLSYLVHRLERRQKRAPTVRPAAGASPLSTPTGRAAVRAGGKELTGR